jgi:5'-nucleotidase
MIVDPIEFARKKALLHKDGAQNLQVISDFDRTITPDKREGKCINSAYMMVGNYQKLSENYREKIASVRNYYLPIEMDPHMTREEKTPKMIEWWHKANQLLVDEHPHMSMLPDMVEHAYVMWREQFSEILRLLEEHGVPLLVFSAGIADLIEQVFKHLEKKSFQNVHVIGNRLVADADGLVVGVEEPVIHVYNKNEASLFHHEHNPWVKNIKHRRNVILMGDSLGDIDMAEGVKHPNVILKIGFVNDKVEERLEAYRKVFDVLILHDGSFQFVLDLLKEIL